MIDSAARRPSWIATYGVVLACYFLNFALFQLAYPFIPLFLVELGESQRGAIGWTGLGQALGSVALMLANPMWGTLARTWLAEEAAQHESTSSSMGAVYGLSQSAHAGGNAIGAAWSAGIAGLLGIPATFVLASVLAVSTGIGWRWLVGRAPALPHQAGLRPP